MHLDGAVVSISGNSELKYDIHYREWYFMLAMNICEQLSVSSVTFLLSTVLRGTLKKSNSNSVASRS